MYININGIRSSLATVVEVDVQHVGFDTVMIATTYQILSTPDRSIELTTREMTGYNPAAVSDVIEGDIVWLTWAPDTLSVLHIEHTTLRPVAATFADRNRNTKIVRTILRAALDGRLSPEYIEAARHETRDSNIALLLNEWRGDYLAVLADDDAVEEAAYTRLVTDVLPAKTRTRRPTYDLGDYLDRTERIDRMTDPIAAQYDDMCNGIFL